MVVVRLLPKSLANRILIEVRLFNEKYVYTGILCLAQLSYGLSCSVFGPSFVDLKHIFNTSMNEISLVTTFMSFGYMAGSLCMIVMILVHLINQFCSGGLLIKTINKRMAMIAALLLMCVMIVLIPYSRQILQLYLCFWLFGFGSGVYVNVKYVWLIDMWQTNSAPVLHLAGFMFGIGHTLGPQIEKPYLTGETGLNDQFLPNGETSMLMVAKDRQLRRHKLMTPYLICGALHLIGPILMILFCSTRPKRSVERLPTDHKESTESTTKEKNGSVKPFERMYSQKVILILLVSVLLSFFSASESAFFAFSATYFQYIPLRLSASKAAELVSMMALTFTVSRGLAIVIAIRLKPHYIIAMFLSILFISLVILFFSANSLTLLWLGIMTMSFGFSPIYASIFSLMGRYVEFTSQISTILMLSANSLNLVLPYMIGNYIETIPNIFLITLIFCITISALFFVFIIYFVIKFKRLTLLKQNGFKVVEQ